MTATLERYGFDAARTAFAGRTAVAACIAFIAGWALGLEHPQWSAMAVWAAAQPTRGQLLEKGFFRIAGTISGTLAGIALVLAMQIHPALLVLGLALWVGLCTAIGNLQRGFVAYGTVLAGYTAAMVSLLDAAHPEHVLHLGADRFATVLTGVVTAMVVGAVFAPPAARGALRARLAALVADLLEAAATPASDARAPALPRPSCCRPWSGRHRCRRPRCRIPAGGRTGPCPLRPPPAVWPRCWPPGARLPHPELRAWPPG